MKLEKWALVAEIIGGFAIVVTLIFLIIEIRGNSAAIRAATATSISDRTQSLLISTISNSGPREALYRQAQGGELSREDEAILDTLQALNLKLAEESFIAFRAGNLDSEVWLTRAEVVLDRMVNEQERARWADRRDQGWYVRDFVDFIDDELASRYGE